MTMTRTRVAAAVLAVLLAVGAVAATQSAATVEDVPRAGPSMCC